MNPPSFKAEQETKIPNSKNQSFSLVTKTYGLL